MRKRSLIVSLTVCVILGICCSQKDNPTKVKPFTYNLNMVHHNPGVPPFDTKYNDPYYLKEQGFKYRKKQM